ncbi:MAG: GlsB/YeaQ/YmgE family stress response membrane protein [Chloroflexota bacterium]|nr:GlsB/YeaQ/YmgE family stress response membrane protein [Chloroflexota bacterium]
MILSFFNIGANNWWETLITAVIGAIILIWIVRAVSGNRRAAV